MIIVLALEMSRPDSTIVVQTRTSKRFSQKSTITCSSCVLAHLAVRDRDPRLGHQLARARAAAFSIDLTRLWTKKTWPSRSSSRRIAAIDLLVVVGADVGQHRVPLLRRGRERRHLADAGDRHLQGARDRRRATSTRTST